MRWPLERAFVGKTAKQVFRRRRSQISVFAVLDRTSLSCPVVGSWSCRHGKAILLDLDSCIGPLDYWLRTPMCLSAAWHRVTARVQSRVCYVEDNRLSATAMDEYVYSVGRRERACVFQAYGYSSRHVNYRRLRLEVKAAA